ncbi:MAG TPA: sulfite exporter TauE/SafE family protein, partial [Chitinophagales bacterium]|nr:sulfite exporter TauE/SafE family protein [Chitinophagales bacterium]
MTTLQIILLAAAAVLGSALNAVAGGGSFFTFPALIFTGVPVLNANATSTIALWPGSIASAYTYRRKLQVKRSLLISFTAISIAGSIGGTSLLLLTPPDVLRSLVPYLMLSATLLLIFKNRIDKNRWMPAAPSNIPVVMALQFIIGAYGGYFGGGMGILMLATFSLMGYSSLQQMNALKSFLGACINGVAVI